MVLRIECWWFVLVFVVETITISTVSKYSNCVVFYHIDYNLYNHSFIRNTMGKIIYSYHCLIIAPMFYVK